MPHRASIETTALLLLLLAVGCQAPPSEGGDDDDSIADDDDAADDDAADDDDSIDHDPPCSVPDDAQEFGDPGIRSSALRNGERAYWTLNLIDDVVLFVQLTLTGLEDEPGTAPIVRIYNSEGEVHAESWSSPFWDCDTQHRTNVAAVLRTGGWWTVEIVPPDDQQYEYSINLDGSLDQPGTTTEAEPGEQFFFAGDVKSRLATFEYDGRTSWFHLTTDCSDCGVALSGGRNAPGSAATARFSLFLPDGTQLFSEDDPAPASDGEQFFSQGGPITPAPDGGLTLSNTDADGQGGPNYWTAWFAFVWEN